MLKPIRSILFATDLTSNCQSALEFTVSVATRFYATIYMLHVIEKLPDHMSERLKGLLGKHQWEEMVGNIILDIKTFLIYLEYIGYCLISSFLKAKFSHIPLYFHHTFLSAVNFIDILASPTIIYFLVFTTIFVDIFRSLNLHPSH